MSTTPLLHRHTAECYSWDNPDDCLSYIFEQKYPQPFCKRCGAVTKLYRNTGRPSYSCVCGDYNLFPMKGTMFENSHLPLDKWFKAIWLVSLNEVRPISLVRDLDVSYPTAWKMAHKLNALRSRHPRAGFYELLRHCL